LEKFVVFLKPGTPVGSLRPEHFSAFMKYLIEQRKLGRHARRRVRACINAMLRYGAKNAWYTMPSTGTDWVAPATDPDSVRQARLRAGLRDYSDRIITGEELDRLLKRASPAFKAIILLGINCGMGPADIGRLRWNMIDMKSGHMKFPRPKTGVMRHGYLWKKTRKALRCARLARQNLKAWDREGDCSLVFLTRSGLPYYREREVHKLVEIGDKKASKLVGISVDNAVSITFRRMAKELKLEGVHFYRLRHTFKTLGKRGGDKEALDLMMGHKDRSVGRIYDHEEIGWRRIRRVARIIYRQLWASPKRQEDTPRPKGRMRIVGGGEWAVA
jgi:integrase